MAAVLQATTAQLRHTIYGAAVSTGPRRFLLAAHVAVHVLLQAVAVVAVAVLQAPSTSQTLVRQKGTAKERRSNGRAAAHLAVLVHAHQAAAAAVLKEQAPKRRDTVKWHRKGSETGPTHEAAHDLHQAALVSADPSPPLLFSTGPNRADTSWQVCSPALRASTG